MTVTQKTNRRVVLREKPTGVLGPDQVELVSGAAPTLADGQALMQTELLAMDAVTRVVAAVDLGIVPGTKIGEPLRSFGAGAVVESRSPQFPVGTRVVGFIDWADYQLLGGQTHLTALPPEVSFEAALNLYGHTAMAAYFGMTEIGRPRPGETVLVSGAAGAVGSVAGQIGKILGCRVGGIAGGREKARWLVEELGFDFAIDHKAGEVGPRLREACPDGVDVFFDNVGGALQDQVVACLAPGARVVACGYSAYLTTADPLAGMKPRTDLVDATIRPFNTMDYIERFPAAADDMLRWSSGGQLKFPQMMIEGLAQAPDALKMLFDGRSRGRVLVRVSRDGAAL